jgi:NADPH-dependent 2,4-dienoyl-CoA reductase/sulfur reductase-like enzyme
MIDITSRKCARRTGASRRTRSSGSARPLISAERERIDNVRPSSWRNPAPAPHYDLVIVDAGTAGLVAAQAAASRGARSRWSSAAS